MKAVITIIIVVCVFWAGKRLFLSYHAIEKESANRQSAVEEQPAPRSSNLPGLPESLEESLRAAEKRGAAGLREWLRNYSHMVRDPRLGSIQLDYIILISHQDPTEARRLFNEVKERTPTFSPLYPRVKRLEGSFQ